MHHQRCFLALLLPLAFATCSLAATEEWRYDGTNEIFQITADGKGGCAITRVTDLGGADVSGDVLWFDKKGQLIYQGGLSNLLGGGIIVCTPKDLVVGDIRRTNLVVHVTRDGTASELPAAAGTLNRPPGRYIASKLVVYDAKGFFAMVSDTNANAYSLVRYRHK
jgi:hypothetical protein